MTDNKHTIGDWVFFRAMEFHSPFFMMGKRFTNKILIGGKVLEVKRGYCIVEAYYPNIQFVYTSVGKIPYHSHHITKVVAVEDRYLITKDEYHENPNSECWHEKN